MGVTASRGGAARMRVVLGAGAELIAVAEGFGRIDGVPSGNAALQRLRQGFERRARGERLAGAYESPEAAVALLSGEIARVNEALHARSASHQDYVSAGCSLTAALIVRRHVVIAHIGATGASLASGERLRSLTPRHVADLPIRLLTRALGVERRADVTVATFEAEVGEVLLLTDARERQVIERRFDDREFASSLVAPRRRPATIAGLAAFAFFLLAMLCAR